jgi:hypothetical protein
VTIVSINGTYRCHAATMTVQTALKQAGTQQPLIMVVRRQGQHQALDHADQSLLLPGSDYS